MESTMKKEKEFNLKDPISFLISASNDYLESSGYEINIRYIDELSNRLSDLFSWISRKCGIKRFRIELSCFLESNKELIISCWFSEKDGEIKVLGGDVDIHSEHSYQNAEVGKGLVSVHILFSEKFSGYWSNLPNSLEKSKVLSEIEKVIRSYFIVPYLRVSSGGAHFEIPIMFDVVRYLI